MHKVSRLNVLWSLLAALAVHLTVLDHIRILGAKPDLLLMLTIFFALFLGGRRGLETGITAGFLKDIFAFDIFGVNMLVLGLTGLLVGISNTKLFKESRVVQVTIVFASSIFSMVLHYVMAASILKFVNLGIADYLASSIIPASVYTALVSLAIFPRLVRIFRLEDGRQFL